MPHGRILSQGLGHLLGAAACCARRAPELREQLLHVCHGSRVGLAFQGHMCSGHLFLPSPCPHPRLLTPIMTSAARSPNSLGHPVTQNRASRPPPSPRPRASQAAALRPAFLRPLPWPAAPRTGKTLLPPALSTFCCFWLKHASPDPVLTLRVKATSSKKCPGHC